jgi:hypothetical protein
MLISMPTGTSMILGAFQAILALLLERANSALLDKLMWFKKFASEIFAREPLTSYVAMQNNSRTCAMRGQTKDSPKVQSATIRRSEGRRQHSPPAPTEVIFNACQGIFSTHG